MSAILLRGCFASNLSEPNLALEWCLAHPMLEPIKKKTHRKNLGPALPNQAPLIDVRFWDKKSVDEKALVLCRKEFSNQEARATPENEVTVREEEREQRQEKDGSPESTESRQQRPLLNERPNHPRWNPKGSTIVRINGRNIDLAALPECSCRPFFVKLRQLEIRHNRISHEVSTERIEEARRIWMEKKEACAFCRDRFCGGFARMREIALERQFQAQLPPELRLKRGRRRPLPQD